MAFEKSLDLMRLAEMAAARHKGVSLVEVTQVRRAVDRAQQGRWSVGHGQ